MMLTRGRVQKKATVWLILSHYDPDFAHDIFKCFYLNEYFWSSTNIALNSIPNGQINNTPALVQMMSWRRPSGKPLSESLLLIYWRMYASLGLNEPSNTVYFTQCTLVFKMDDMIFSFLLGSKTRLIGSM